MDEYITGLDDALDIAAKVMKESKNLPQAKRRIAKIQEHVKERRHEKMKSEFFMFGGLL